MKARLIEDKTGQWLLFATGEMVAATKYELKNLLCNFKTLFYSLKAADGRKWDNEYPDIVSVPGETLAYITDANDLVIVDFAPFIPLFDDVCYSIEDVVTAYEYAEMHRKSVEQVKVFCRAGRIRGAVKVGRDWVIPKDASYPLDHRSGSPL